MPQNRERLYIVGLRRSDIVKLDWVRHNKKFTDMMNQCVMETPGIRDFLIGQGYSIGAATIYQDNMSTMALAKNGRSNSDRTRHINIRYFFVKDRVEQGDVKIEYMPTGDMVADVLTKPLQGSLFARLRDLLLNCCVV